MEIYKHILGESNAKTVKGEKYNYLTGILYMSPSNIVEGVNVCPFASKGCREACLYTAGRGKFSNVQQARQRKTVLFRDNINLFMQSIVKDVGRIVRKAERKQWFPTIRLNGTSDISYERIKDNRGLTVFDLFNEVQFYDYTKSAKRVLKNKINNYHLTYSASERCSDALIKKILKSGNNVAMVFNKLPEKYLGYKVINGDETDLRFKDEKGVIVGLIAKGDAKKDKSGFVRLVA